MTTPRASPMVAPRARALPAHRSTEPSRFGTWRDMGVLSVIVAMAGSGAVTLALVMLGPVYAGPLNPPPPMVAAAGAPLSDRDIDRQLQRDYDQTVPALVASYDRLERKLDRAEERLEAIQNAQRDLEALKTYTVAIATGLGALILGVVAQITQSWMNGRMLKGKNSAD